MPPLLFLKLLTAALLAYLAGLASIHALLPPDEAAVRAQAPAVRRAGGGLLLAGGTRRAADRGGPSTTL
jgi:hypothetical protein